MIDFYSKSLRESLRAGKDYRPGIWVAEDRLVLPESVTGKYYSSAKFFPNKKKKVVEISDSIIYNMMKS